MQSRVLDISLPLDSDSIEECFDSFLNPLMSDHVCEKCQRTSRFQQNMKFEKVPEILVVAMLRFGMNGRKIQKNVRFGFNLNLSEACVDERDGKFELFAVIVHNGLEIQRGHYVCHLKCADGVWYYCDDLKIVKESRSGVLKSIPYMLFYRRKEIMPPVYVQFGIPENGAEA
jgi:ubiquitin carboxyl-terminal hydrolase 36/42